MSADAPTVWPTDTDDNATIARWLATGVIVKPRYTDDETCRWFFDLELSIVNPGTISEFWSCEVRTQLYWFGGGPRGKIIGYATGDTERAALLKMVEYARKGQMGWAAVPAASVEKGAS